ncbi:hypothetical protein GQ457_15G016810 [Hibiscus cannabinus]
MWVNSVISSPKLTNQFCTNHLTTQFLAHLHYTRTKQKKSQIETGKEREDREQRRRGRRRCLLRLYEEAAMQ